MGDHQERILYLGPEGTFTHTAARDLAPPGALLEAATEARLVIAAVDSGEADGGVVAFENSLDGTVGATIDKLLHEADGCLIAGERVLAVSFDLYRRREDPSKLRRLIGHPVALAQVSRLIEHRNLEVGTAASNIAALVDLSELDEPGVGAVGPPGQADRFALRVEAEGVEDSPRPASCCCARAPPGRAGATSAPSSCVPRARRPAASSRSCSSSPRAGSTSPRSSRARRARRSATTCSTSSARGICSTSRCTAPCSG